MSFQHSLSEFYSLRKESEAKKGTISTFSGIANIANLIVGSGVISLPGSVCKTGIILSFFSLVGFYLAATWSANKIVDAKIRTNSKNYSEACQKLLGPFGYWLLNSSLWVLLLCMIWVYLVLTTEFQMNLWALISSNPKIAHDVTVRKIGTLCISAAVLPLACLRDLQFLSFTSTLGVICVLFFIVCSLVSTSLDKQDHEAFMSKHGKANTELFSWGIPSWSNFLEVQGAMGAFFVAHCCHHGVCSIHESLESPASWKTVSAGGIGIAFLFNLIVSYGIYFLFYDFTCALPNQEFTKLFSHASGAAYYWNDAACTIMSLAICSTIPLVHFFMRDLSWSIFNYANGDETSGEMPNWFFYGHLVFWGISTILAIFAPQAIVIIDFCGSFSSCLIMIVLPILLDFEMNGGILYFLSCGLVSSKTENDPEPCVEMGTESSSLEGVYVSNGEGASMENSTSQNLIRFTVLNMLLIFGVSQVGISFYTLYQIFAGEK